MFKKKNTLMFIIHPLKVSLFSLSLYVKTPLKHQSFSKHNQETRFNSIEKKYFFIDSITALFSIFI